METDEEFWERLKKDRESAERKAKRYLVYAWVTGVIGLAGVTFFLYQAFK